MNRILVTGGSGFIGTYLIGELLKRPDLQIINIDMNAPFEKTQEHLWKKVDITKEAEVLQAFLDFQPTEVVHLAARTDTFPEHVMSDYDANTTGTANILAGIKATSSIQRVVITSTQFVNQYNGMPAHDQDYAPHTVYGESKVITENMTRAAELDCCWTIIRPTNIWGPGHPRYPKEFWYVLKKGRYIHPGKKPVIRSYGYVGNVVDQIIKILEKEKQAVNGCVFYVGDESMNIYYWANGFSLALTGKNVKVVPRFVVKSLALVGDILRVFKIKFPITSSRYKSMTNGNMAPMEKTFHVLGPSKYSLKEGIDETVSWLKTQDTFWNR